MYLKFKIIYYRLKIGKKIKNNTVGSVFFSFIVFHIVISLVEC